jgi:acetyltransferase-like isoleucine patch superfamily enzyme
MAVPRIFSRYILYAYRRVKSRVREAGLRFFVAEVGQDVRVWGRVRIDYPDRVYIGDDCAFNEGVLILAREDVRIGRGVVLSANVTITSASLEFTHSPPPYEHISAPVVIKDYVWIGTGAVILPGVTIGEGSVIGAGAVVTRNIPENVVAAGNPAQVVRQLPPYLERSRQVTIAA